jgi:hypothetical protein
MRALPGLCCRGAVLQMGYRANVVPMFFCFVFFGEKKVVRIV